MAVLMAVAVYCRSRELSSGCSSSAPLNTFRNSIISSPHGYSLGMPTNISSSSLIHSTLWRVSNPKSSLPNGEEPAVLGRTSSSFARTQLTSCFLPCGSLKSENSASMAVRGKDGRRRRSSCSRETWDCLCTVGMCWVREMRKRTRPTSSSLRENTWKDQKCDVVNGSSSNSSGSSLESIHGG